jgi:arylsulfatase A-like enzyme
MVQRLIHLSFRLAGLLILLPLLDGKDSRPNVVFVIADDLNDFAFRKTLSIERTPHLDAFRKSAVTFYNAYCTAPVCEPSRASVFSGLFPHHTGSYLNASDPWRKAPLASVEALPELFKRNGYTTFGRGKLLHAKLAEGREERMWDNRPLVGGGFGPYPPEEDQIEGSFWGVTPWEGPDSDFPDVDNVEATVQFLNQSHEDPFFLVLGLWRPHAPFTAPKRFFDLYDPRDIPIPLPGFLKDDLSDVPPYGHYLSSIWGSRFEVSGYNVPENWRRIVHGYLACSSFADWSIGKVIQAVDASDERDNTIVIVWSDNGYHLGEKSHFEKNTVWEKAAMTPLVIRLPEGKGAGETVLASVSSIDLYPTLMDYCGLEAPAHDLDGQSLRPLFENPEGTRDRPAITVYGQGVFSARDDRFRYIQYPDGSTELYDMLEDPHEYQNLANNPSLAEVKRRLSVWYPSDWAFSLGGRHDGTNRVLR